MKFYSEFNIFIHENALEKGVCEMASILSRPQCVKQHGFLMEELIGYTHANFHHATTFGCRNIAFQIWWLPCNPHRCEWPKTFLRQCNLPLWGTSGFFNTFGYAILFSCRNCQLSPCIAKMYAPLSYSFIVFQSCHILEYVIISVKNVHLVTYMLNSLECIDI